MQIYREGKFYVSIGRQFDTWRYGIIVGLGKRENCLDGEIIFKRYWRWSLPSFRLLWCDDKIVGINAFGRSRIFRP